MSDNNKISAKIISDITKHQPKAISDAYKESKNDPGILSLLALLSSPFEATGQAVGADSLEHTNSPLAATLAYLAGSGMLGTAPVTMPLKGAKSALDLLKYAKLVGGKSGEIPIQDLLKYKDKIQVPEGMKALYHASDMPWEGSAPRPGTWFADELPNPAYSHGSTVRAYMYPDTTPISKPISRGSGKENRLREVVEPIAQIEDGAGVTSYQVLDPSVLRRLEINR